MTDGGLTQDDFRRLLQTPREPPKEPEFKAPAPKTPKPANGGSVFAVPHALRKKRPRPAPREKDEEQDNEKNVVESTPRYRDRAAERRMQQDETAAPEATPIKKGLDFELLRKTRAELSAKQNIKEQQKQEQASSSSSSSSSSSKENGDEDDDEQDKQLEEALKENVPASDEPVPFPAVDEPVIFNSVMAKNIYDFIRTNPPKNELFAPGRMAFVFELADEVGHYNDAYAIPTSLIRSRADKKAALDDLKQKTELVVSKISKIMSEQSAKEKKKREEQEKKKKVEAPIVTFDGDIFADVGRDYELDEETLARASTSAAAAAAAAKEEEQTTIPETTKGDYFKGLKEQDEEEDVEMKDVDIDMASLLSQAAKQRGEEMPGERPAKKQRFFQEEEMDADANDIDMFGLGASALPTSFEERRRTVAYGSGDEDEATTSMLDQGTHRNKKAQLMRWDFDDEEQWQKYKDSIEIMPKSASQYGVKMGDGRKRNREQRKGMSEKQKLNREYQMVKSIMEKKYGTKPA